MPDQPLKKQNTLCMIHCDKMQDDGREDAGPQGINRASDQGP